MELSRRNSSNLFKKPQNSLNCNEAWYCNYLLFMVKEHCQCEKWDSAIAPNLSGKSKSFQCLPTKYKKTSAGLGRRFMKHEENEHIDLSRVIGWEVLPQPYKGNVRTKKFHGQKQADPFFRKRQFPPDLNIWVVHGCQHDLDIKSFIQVSWTAQSPRVSVYNSNLCWKSMGNLLRNYSI